MQYGIPVCCWIDQKTYRKAYDHCLNLPIIQNEEKTIIGFVYTITADMQIDLMKWLSDHTKKYCDEIHSYQSIAKLWDKLYKSII